VTAIVVECVYMWMDWYFTKIFSGWNYNFWQPKWGTAYRDKLEVLLIY
jgi:hypothetical protein